MVSALYNSAKGFSLIDKLKLKLQICKAGRKRSGRKLTSLATRQLVMAHWHSSVTPSTNTDRPAKLRVSQKPKIQNDLPFNSTVIIARNKRNIELYHNLWHITNDTFKQLYHNYLVSHPNNPVSYGTFVSLKPFYIRAATARDIEMCMCKIHLHTRRAVNALIKLCKEQGIELFFDSYLSFFNYIQENCPKTIINTYLLWSCTPTKKELCEHQKSKWCALKQELLGKADSNVVTNFQYFVKKDVEKKGEVKKRLVAESISADISFIVSFIDDLLSKIVHHRNLLKNFRTAYPLVLESLSTTEISLDFSENLTLALPQEIQSMYYGQAKNVVSVHSGLLRKGGDKQYHPYVSDDLVHDQCFVYKAINEMMDDIEIDEGSSLIITGDNCCNQYKSARNFFHLLKISKDYNINNIRIYGVASHGKNEVDTVGGVAKIAIRSEVSRGKAFFNAKQCLEYLSEKFASSTDPTYHLKLIEKSELEELRSKEKFIRCPTVKGSSSFQVIVFEPSSNNIRVAPYLCSCEQCINVKYGSCALFTTHELVSGVLNEVALRSHYQPPVSENVDSTDKSLICNDSVCAIAAIETSADTVWLIYIVDCDAVNEEGESTDSYGHVIPRSQQYIICNYLEKHKDSRKGVTYKRNSKEAYIYKESIVYPAVNIEFNNGLYFLNNEEYVEILNFVQHTSMGSLF